MHTTLWIITVIGGLIGGFILITGLMSANGAPQEAAAAAAGVAFVVIPYCIARASDEISKWKDYN